MGGFLHGLVDLVVNPDLLSTYGMRLLLGLQITAETVLLSCCIGFMRCPSRSPAPACRATPCCGAWRCAT